MIFILILVTQMRSVNLPLCFEDKDYGPRTVKDLKLISAGKILENNRTVGECQSPLCDLPGGVTTMHVVVQPPSVEKGLVLLFNIYLSILLTIFPHISGISNLYKCL